MKAQQFSRSDFSDLLDLVANNAAQRPIGHTYLMTSDVTWQFPGCAPKENIRLWQTQAGLMAFAWFQPPDSIKFDFCHDMVANSEILGEILEWAEERRAKFPPSYPFYIDLNSMDEWAELVREPPPHESTDRYIVTSALESDDERLELLHQNGFRTTLHFEPILTCDLCQVQIPDTPAMFTIRSVEDADFEARVALHSAAWAPASGFNMDQYQKVRAISQVFDPDLDIVAVDPNGTLASYTIAWIDPVSLIGSFEPFGTHPDYRRTGVSRAVIGEGFRRMIANGMQFARIYTAGFNHQAAKLYKSCGFTEVDVSRTLIKRI